MLTKLSLLKFLLFIGSAYYVIGGVVHLFGLTIFPFYDGVLYSPYHDTVIALSAFSIAIILFIVNRSPAKNIDTLNAIIVCGLLAILFSFYILFKIDLTDSKRMQTWVELIFLIFYTLTLVFLRPKRT